MNLLQDIITYIRRIVKTPSTNQLSDDIIIDYINRFWTTDVEARLQLFDLKTKYQFQTTPGVDKYNMPFYDVQIQPGNQPISFYPVYQGFMDPVYINGARATYSTQRAEFYNMWSQWVTKSNTVATGDGIETNFSFQIPQIGNSSNSTRNNQGIVRGHVDLRGIIATGFNIDPIVGDNLNISVPVSSVTSEVFITTLNANNESMVVQDSGQFLNTNINCGLLMNPGKNPTGNSPLSGGYTETSNVVNYSTGFVNVKFPSPPKIGEPIIVQSRLYQNGLPQSLLYHNNTITLRTVPDTQYLVELDAYLTPSAFLSSSDSIPFAYMSEYIARGAARKILSDTGDEEQLNLYEPFFREQEMNVLRRSDRQKSSTRRQTIYSIGKGNGQYPTLGAQL